MGAWPMLMADQRVGGNALYIPGVLPHFKVELHPVIDEEMDAERQSTIGNDQGNKEHT